MAAEGLVRKFSLLLAGFVLAGCSGATSQRGHIPVIPETTVAPAPNSVVEPSQLIIDKISVNTALHPTGLEKDGTIHVPDLDHVDETYWLCAQHYLDAGKPTCHTGVVPGSVGPAILVAHVDGKGKPGAFNRLRELRDGDSILLRRVDGSTVTFMVYRTQQVHKDNFPTRDVYSNRPGPELVLLTCTGKFVGGSLGYEDQQIVFAKLA